MTELSFTVALAVVPPVPLQLGTADTEVEVPSVDNPGLPKVLPLKPAVGQTIATHASHAAMELLFFSFLPFWSI